LSRYGSAQYVRILLVIGENWPTCIAVNAEHGGSSIVVPSAYQRAERLFALRVLNILDTPPEIAYDEIAELAAQICGCPVAYISFIDDDRRWLKAKYGLPPDVSEAPREAAVCSTTICGTEVLVVPDMTQDPRFDCSPMVVGKPHCRFYCGMPLITDAGYALGTLCVMDFEPRQLSLNRSNPCAGCHARCSLNWSCVEN
jgi:adenylate cyclase